MNSFRHVYRATSVGFAAFAGLALVSGCCSSSGHKTASYHQTSAAYAETQPAATEQAAPTPTGRMEATGTTVVPLYEEKINVGKREVDTGSVTIKKVVKTETVNQPIELRHEEIIVERQPAGAAVSGNKILDQPFQEGQQTVTAKSEVAVVEKQTTTSGQVVLSTRSSTTQTNIQGEVRREEVAIDKQGAAQGAGAAESPGGKASATSGTITDPSTLSTSSDASQWNGRQVQFTGVKVRRVIGDKIFVLDGGNGQQIYVFNKEEANTCKAGDLMNVNGTIKTRAGFESGQILDLFVRTDPRDGGENHAEIDHRSRS
jgi:uncharacterized protein (TIGR02271 family)